MRVAIEGCAHGELESIYDVIAEAERVHGKKVDLLICCGDFQATRNLKDLQCMAVPDKYKDMGTFYKYYSGEKVAPVLTIFIGGNHEASNHLQELAYGGWAAPNIYYLGYAGVVNVGGLRIAGLSGIYKNHDLMKGHYEYPPYNSSSMRSAYHIRNLEIFKLKQLSGHVDICLSHDWPLGVTEYGDVDKLLRKKSFLREDIDNNCLGSPPAMDLLKHHYPSYWFSAHLHCKFAAVVPNEDYSKTTKFLALDKCLPRRQYLQIIEIEHDQSLPIKLSYDLEWLTILFLTNHLLSVKSGICYMPGPANQGRWIFTPSEEEKEKIHHRFNYDLSVPLNFKVSVEPYNPESPHGRVNQPNISVNNQTTEFCNKLGIDDPFALLKVVSGVVEESDSANTSFSQSITSTPSNKTDSCADLSYSSDEKISDREEEGEGSPQFVIDTVPSSIPRLMMSPLKLPTAKNDSTLSTQDEDSPKHSQNSSKSSRSFEDVEVEQTDDVKAQPNFKKFKRRNEAIYTDNECVT